MVVDKNLLHIKRGYTHKKAIGGPDEIRTHDLRLVKATS